MRKDVLEGLSEWSLMILFWLQSKIFWCKNPSSDGATEKSEMQSKCHKAVKSKTSKCRKPLWLKEINIPLCLVMEAEDDNWLLLGYVTTSDWAGGITVWWDTGEWFLSTDSTECLVGRSCTFKVCKLSVGNSAASMYLISPHFDGSGSACGRGGLKTL